MLNLIGEGCEIIRKDWKLLIKEYCDLLYSHRVRIEVEICFLDTSSHSFRLFSLLLPPILQSFISNTLRLLPLLSSVSINAPNPLPRHYIHPNSRRSICWSLFRSWMSKLLSVVIQVQRIGLEVCNTEIMGICSHMWLFLWVVFSSSFVLFPILEI